MSIVLETCDGWIIDQRDFINKSLNKTIYDSKVTSYKANKILFNITSKYLRPDKIKELENANESLKIKKRKRKKSNHENKELSDTIDVVKTKFNSLINESKSKGYFQSIDWPTLDSYTEGKEFCDLFYSRTAKIKLNGLLGGNLSSNYLISEISNELFLIPPNCSFYCYDVCEMKNILELENQYDLILLDPPWWNKSVRRKKVKCTEGSSYDMLYNEDIASLPIKQLLTPNALVVMWCTNANNNLMAVKDVMFPQWGVELKTKWFWVKITNSGNSICDFNCPPGKQPFEQIIIGQNIHEQNTTQTIIPNNKIIVSVPSVIHSQKPSLTEILAPYLPTSPKCLELFARSLLPNWTSYGLEAVRLQHLSLYEELDLCI